jgi:hypothetical protein
VEYIVAEVESRNPESWLPGHRITRTENSEYVVFQSDNKARGKGAKEAIVAFFTETAPYSEYQHAFLLDLSCLWSWRGCKKAAQLLPAAAADQKVLEALATQRLRSNVSCPERTLPYRVGEGNVIALAEVIDLKSDGPESRAGASHAVTYKIVRPLLGEFNHKSEIVWHHDNIRVSRDVWLPNHALSLATPGKRVILFLHSVSSDQLGPEDDGCDLIDATESAVRSVDAAVAARRSNQNDGR